MEQYLSHISAAAEWNIPYIEYVFGYDISKAADAHITVPDHDARISINGKRAHSCALPLPAGAVVYRNGKRVASPELLFLELANELSIHRLILLGLQMCSYPVGSPEKAITTKKDITAFLENTSGHRGHRKALQAIKYVENGSASIMESLAYMILTLPSNLGGYGLQGAVFNHRFRLNDEEISQLSQNSCIVDIYYRRAKVAVEYESYKHHSSPAEQGKDAIRSEILRKHGVEVKHLSTIQLYNKDACRDFARSLSCSIKKRIRIQSVRFEEMHEQLRELLPNKDREPNKECDPKLQRTDH
jgi:very-short-patch-repair endonuclease